MFKIFLSIDMMPYNLTAAAAKIKGITLMPTYGLNVYSILKREYSLYFLFYLSVTDWCL